MKNLSSLLLVGILGLNGCAFPIISEDPLIKMEIRNPSYKEYEDGSYDFNGYHYQKIRELKNGWAEYSEEKIKE